MIEENQSSSSIVVVVEWDGKKPSSTFYNRLHEYGLYSKGRDKSEFSLLEWRSTRKGTLKRDSRNGFVLQEGLIVVSNMTLAKDIKYWAEQEGAELVQIGFLNLADFKMSPKDIEHYNRFTTVVSRRGPKPESEKGVYIVTCYDEAKSYEVDTTSIPVMCPMCHGSNVQSRMGRLPRYQKYNEQIAQFDTVEDYWIRTRFSSGQFEVPFIDDGSDDVFANLPKEIVTAELPKLSKTLPAPMKEAMQGDSSISDKVFDAAHCVNKMSEQTRNMGRLAVVNAYIMAGGQAFLSWTAPDDGVDTVDLCIVNEEFKVWLPK